MAKQWSKEEIDKFTSELGNNIEKGEGVDDSAAFDIADGLLETEGGLKESIAKEYGIELQYVQEWLADKI
jgi:hypothetical protein